MQYSARQYLKIQSKAYSKRQANTLVIVRSNMHCRGRSLHHVPERSTNESAIYETPGGLGRSWSELA